MNQSKRCQSRLFDLLFIDLTFEFEDTWNIKSSTVSAFLSRLKFWVAEGNENHWKQFVAWTKWFTWQPPVSRTVSRFEKVLKTCYIRSELTRPHTLQDENISL